PQYVPLPAYNVALLPNVGAYDSFYGQLAAGTVAAGGFGAGGLDETWDAPDLQNMFLAMVPPRAAEMFFTGTRLPIIPSFHRPELINFWINNPALNGPNETPPAGRNRLFVSNVSQIA